MQCAICQHAKPNTGMVIPVVDQTYFCTAVPDGETAHILTGILQEFSKDRRCPSYAAFEVMPDSYLSEDLHGRDIRSEAVLQTMVPTSDEE